MLLCEPLASLITFFRTSLINFFLNNELMTDPICINRVLLPFNTRGGMIKMHVIIANFIVVSSYPVKNGKTL